MSKTDSLVQTREHDSVTELRLNRPDKLNAVHDPLLEAIHEALAAVSEEPTSALLLTGAGSVTCAGRDVETVSQDDFERHELQPELGPMIAEYPLPTAMAGKGAVIGMGLGLSLNFDFFLVGEDTSLSLPEVNYDIDTSGTIPRLAPIVGERVAREIVMRGAEFDGQRAHELGLANDIVPEDEVDQYAREFLEEVMSADRDILRRMVETARPS